MPIHYNKETKEFHLQAKYVSYIFNILRNNQLCHLYYGKHIRHRDSFNHLYIEEFRDNSTHVLMGDQTVSLDHVTQEVPVYGTSVFRAPAYQVLKYNGSRNTYFEYISH